MNEKLIERKFREGVKKRGGLALKFMCPFFTGLPDRIVLLPGGVVRFAELKTTGEKLRGRQKIVKRMLEKLGFTVDVIDNQNSLTRFLESI